LTCKDKQMTKATIGIIGLGKMGGNLALQAVEKGFQVIGESRSFKEHLQKEHLSQANDLKSFSNGLPNPRMILMFLPAGNVVDKIIEDISPFLSPGDVLADCGNSYWGDSIRREENIRKTGIHFVDCGTSGGPGGARHGACFMVGGSKEAVRIIEPVFKALSVDGGYVYTGKTGSGHFTKLVHNGIEFGMMQSIGEGINLLHHYREPLDIVAILQCRENGSVIRSWLIELMRKQLQEQNDITHIPAYVEDTGEVNWLVTDAMHMEVPIPVIAQSVMQLMASRDNENIWAKAIAMMRHGFGGHPVRRNEEIKQERMLGQVNGFLKNK
jgi:6-phosphogluconate dehydrogenase